MAGKKVLVTGGYGRVGTAILENLSDEPGYQFTCFDRSERPPYLSTKGFRTVSGDVTDINEVRTALESKDAVIHLASYPAVSTSWEKVLNNNIVGTYNVLQAAAEKNVEKFIYASSNHIVGMYEQEFAPDIYYSNSDFMLDHQTEVRPDSYYGVGKSFGESIGRYYSETRELSFISIRICSLRIPKYDHPYGDAEKGVAEGKWTRDDDSYREQVARMKCMWCSRRDLAQLVDLSLRDDEIDYDIFYGVSDNDRRWHDIQHARNVLGYDPEDNGETWEEPPNV